LIRTSPEQKKEIIEAIQSGKDKIYRNEKVWNFLIADILSDPSFQKQFFTSICDDSISINPNYDYDIWLESQPIPPRKGKSKASEGKTKLDIAFGSIKQRYNSGKSTKSGIEFDPENENGWICFVEGKFKSELSTRTTYDSCKNQLIRVIENALCFQGDRQAPKKTYVVLLTPRAYQSKQEKNYYKIMKECENQDYILRSIKSSQFPERPPFNNWQYPNIADRIKLLKKPNWVFYEMIIEKAYGIPKIDLTNLSDEEKIYLKKILNNLAKKLEESI